MNEEERQKFNALSAQVHVLSLVVAQLCRRTLNQSDIDAILAPIDSGVAWGDPESSEALNEALLRSGSRL